jgi:hypothetical protein
VSFTPADLKATIAAAAKEIGGDGDTYFTEWNIILDRQSAYLSLVLTGSTKPEAAKVLEKVGALIQITEVLYRALCEFDWACNDAIKAY